MHHNDKNVLSIFEISISINHVKVSFPSVCCHLKMWGEWLLWVACRPSSPQIHRRKADNEIPTPKSSHSPLSSTDPKETFRVFRLAAAMQQEAVGALLSNWLFQRSTQSLVVS